MKAIIVINFKLYKEAVGNKALVLAKKLTRARKNGYIVAVAPSMLSLKEIAQKTNLPVFAQHMDHIELGAHTGRVAAA